MDKVMVYFTNGCKAQFDPKKAIFLDMADPPAFDVGLRLMCEQNVAIVNWGSVSFIQPVQEDKKDE